MHLLSAARQIVAARKACFRACDRFVINRAGLLKIPRQVPFRNGGRINNAHKIRQFFCCLSVLAYLSRGFNYSLKCWCFLALSGPRCLFILHREKFTATIKVSKLCSFDLGSRMGAKQPWRRGWSRCCPTAVLCTKMTFTRWVSACGCFRIFFLSHLLMWAKRGWFCQPPSPVHFILCWRWRCPFHATLSPQWWDVVWMTPLILFIPWCVRACACWGTRVCVYACAWARVCVGTRVCPSFVLVLVPLSLCVGSGMWVWTALVGSCEVAAMFYWWLLFQKPDQIEVGEDGFKQWDGKTSQKTASDPRLPSCQNFHPLIPHTHSHFKLTSVLASLIISTILERNRDIFLNILFIIGTYLF